MTYALPSRPAPAQTRRAPAHVRGSIDRRAEPSDATQVQADAENAAARQADAQNRANDIADQIAADIASKFEPIQAQADAHWVEADRLMSSIGKSYQDLAGILVEPSDAAAKLNPAL